MTIVRGVDVSKAKPPSKCNWSVAYGSGIRFVYVKGSEGAPASDTNEAYVDEAALEHLAGIRRTPLLVGMFHVARPDRRFRESRDGYANGVLEARHAVDTAIGLGLAWSGSLPLCLDLEKYVPAEFGTRVEQRDDFVRGLVVAIEAAIGRAPVVYAGQDYWSHQHSRTLATELRERGCLLWQVDYTTKPDPTESIPGWPWSMWQHSGGGKFAYAPAVPGLPTPIDQNIYRGSLAELRGLCSA